ncbi:formimidoylglutamase [Spongiivirga citrea]|uniref:Formimidoylglutamase n=1 Tax=Spongiivirga citrea TaxID=1481457 RepID=A0A6M0CFX2_9FLAO|nr:formimidoylglutamase [Spongiivirga citrea]NER16748.1 formimidoylglutamase [Spongiivirga citrea]
MDFSKFNINYKPTASQIWTGRKTDPNAGTQYWYQAIHQASLEESASNTDIGLIGYACDEGVKRNLGRIGAKKGPTVIKERLAKLSFHHFDNQIVDFGDISCIEDDLESCQEAFAQSIAQLLANNSFPIAIGGGHDIAYAHFKGIHDHLKDQANNRIGIINFDAHFDLRPVLENGNSGTPFNQIFDGFDNVSYFALGIQKASNTSELFQIAKENKVEFILNDECNLTNISSIQQRLDAFLMDIDHLYITIDLDGFSSAYAPGVSAPSPVGIHADFGIHILKYLFKSSKVISCDIAEMNPVYDQDSSTANLAARLIDCICEFHSN